MNNLFCEASGYQCLCLNHHTNKTNKENIQRRINKKASISAHLPKIIVKKLNGSKKNAKKRLTSKKK